MPRHASSIWRASSEQLHARLEEVARFLLFPPAGESQSLDAATARLERIATLLAAV